MSDRRAHSGRQLSCCTASLLGSCDAVLVAQQVTTRRTYSDAPDRPPSVGLVHDYLLVMRGAERTFAAIASLWPSAPIYTLLYDRAGTEDRFAERLIYTSYLRRLGIRQRGFRRLLPLFPSAATKLPVGEHDLILSSSSAFAHGVRPRPGATHICYCHSPFRYAWHERSRALAEAPRPLRPVARRVLDRVRRWDLAAAANVTHYIANSELTRARIHDFYGRDASVVHPPVETHRFSPGTPQDFFLVVTELVRHKRVEVALEAARKARRRIKVVGEGPELAHLRETYGRNAEFLGRLGDDELARLYPRALALVVPNVEEFGIAPVESMASGRPVIAAAGGGALETVIDGETGILVTPGDVGELASAMIDFEPDAFSSDPIRGHAERFSTDAFCRRIRAEVDRHTRPQSHASL